MIRNRNARFAALLFALLPLIACGDNEGGTTPEPEPECRIHRQCAPDGVCIDGECVAAPTCSGLGEWGRCYTTLNALEPELGRYGTCMDGYCVPVCVTDTDCLDGETCADFGRCVPFTGELGADPGGGARAPLQAGHGRALLNYPIGSELGGYGSRAGGRPGRYASSLSASAGTLNGQYAEAVALDNGERQLMLIRLPMIFTTSNLHERVARALQAETGADWRNSLVISTTHTHSGPARYWRLPTDAAIPLGILGAGDFHQTIEDWLVASIAEAALNALGDMQPAAMGWEIVEAFDMEDSVGRDRWSQTPKFDMNRMLLIRIDNRTTNVPIAVLFSYAAHGTDNSSDYATDDALGGAEFGLSTALSEAFGTHVPALFFSESSGSMSPASGSVGHRWPHTRDRAGWVVADKAMPALMGMELRSDVDLDAHTYRWVIRYDDVGYERFAFGTTGTPPLGGEYTQGGIQCNGSGWNADGFDTFAAPEDLRCLSVSFLIHNRNPTELTRTQVTALNLDGLAVLTAPGEATQEIGWQMIRMLNERFGLDPASSWVLGYAQDHLLYLTPTNLRGPRPPLAGMADQQAPDDYPDFAFSFLQGGYEPGMQPWGWRFGDYFIERAADAWAMMQDRTHEPSIPMALPTQYSRVNDPEFGVNTQRAEDVGGIVEDVPEIYERLSDPLVFSWLGGDPGAEAPQTPLVTLQRRVSEGPDTWEDVLHPSGLPYSNRLPLFATSVRIAEPVDDGSYTWVVRWEALQHYEAGMYRLHVRGHYIDDASGERTPYTTTSSSFVLMPTDRIEIAGASTGDDVNVSISYPANTALSFAGVAGDRGLITGSLRARHVLVPTGSPFPVEPDTIDSIAVVWTDGVTDYPADPSTWTVVTALETVGGRSGVPVTRLQTSRPAGAPAGADAVVITVADQWGNSGVATIDL